MYFNSFLKVESVVIISLSPKLIKNLRINKRGFRFEVPMQLYSIFSWQFLLSSFTIIYVSLPEQLYFL